MKTIPLTQGRVALVDDEDFAWLSQFRWHYHKDKNYRHGYAKRRKDTLSVLQMHVEILKRHGLWTPGQVDHENGCGLDNRKTNLRATDATGNGHNQVRRRDNTSGVIGVSWCKESERWRAHIRVNGKKKYLGEHTDKDDAIAARLEAENKYFGEFRHNPLNLCPGWLDLCPDCSARFADLIPPTTPVDWDALTI